MPDLYILTSGGDAPGMNAAVGAATKSAHAMGWTVRGVEDGYDGLMDGRFVALTPATLDGTWQRGGTELGSARSDRFRTPEGRARAAAHLGPEDALLVIGGNGSLTGALALHREHGTRVVGIPASIDNDVACTSAAIGVDTALNTIVQACDRLLDTARSHRRVFIVEVMGRQCGYLAMASAIAAAADAVLFREQGKGEDQLVDELRAVIQRAFSPERRKRRVIVIKAEGVEVSTERVCERLRTHIAEDAPGVSIRPIVLGHVVRGGNPSFRDRLIAARLAYGAVSALTDGRSGMMVGWEPTEPGGIPTPDSAVTLFPLDRVLDETDRLLDGTHPVTRRRLALLEAAAGVLPL